MFYSKLLKLWHFDADGIVQSKDKCRSWSSDRSGQWQRPRQLSAGLTSSSDWGWPTASEAAAGYSEHTDLFQQPREINVAPDTWIKVIKFSITTKCPDIQITPGLCWFLIKVSPNPKSLCQSPLNFPSTPTPARITNKKNMKKGYYFILAKCFLC